MGSSHGSRAASKPPSFFAPTMKLFGLLSLVAATIGMNLKEPVVNEVIDLVESGLGESKEGRALFITLTLTQSTWSVVETVSTDLTTISSCLAATITECAAARSSLQKDVSNGPAILTMGKTGEKVDVHAIKPTKAQAMFDRMDIDGVIHEHDDPISSGSLSFREWRTWQRDAEGRMRLREWIGCQGLSSPPWSPTCSASPPPPTPPPRTPAPKHLALQLTTAHPRATPVPFPR